MPVVELALSAFLIAIGASLYLFWRLQSPEERLRCFRERYSMAPAWLRPREENYDEFTLTLARWPFIMGTVFFIGIVVRTFA
jgi:hypothetical protein